MPTTQGKLSILHGMASPSSRGYDFYKRLKLAASAVALDPDKADDVFAALSTIKREAERGHNILMAKRFLSWWNAQAGAVPSHTRLVGSYQTPEMLFNIRLRPELVYELDGQTIVTYLWATKSPKLLRQTGAAGLVMLRTGLKAKTSPKTRFQILDLRQERVLTEDIVTNLSEDHLRADLALINSVWRSSTQIAA